MGPEMPASQKKRWTFQIASIVVFYILGVFSSPFLVFLNQQEPDELNSQPANEIIDGTGAANCTQGSKELNYTDWNNTPERNAGTGNCTYQDDAILNHDAIRARQVCRFTPKTFSGAPFVNGDMFRLFCDFIWEKDCFITGDEEFWPGCAIWVQSPYLPRFFNISHKIKVPYVLVTGNADTQVPIDKGAKSATKDLNPTIFLDEWADQVLKCKYVLSPRGHGVDTHSHWESLMLGAIPITFPGILDKLFEDVPILIVPHLGAVTVELMHNRYEEFRTRLQHESYKVYSSYWLQKIRLKMQEAKQFYLHPPPHAPATSAPSVTSAPSSK